MSNTIEHLQILYEIAISIGSSLDLRPMLKNSLAVLLKKLNCSAGGFFSPRPNPPSNLALNDLQGIYYEEVFTIPRSNAQNKAYQAAIRRLPKSIPTDRLEVFFQQLPLSGQEDPGSYFYILELPDVGLLILTKYGEGLDPVILKSLKLISNKLAGACKACLQNAALHESEKRMTDIIYSMGDWVWEVDVNGRYIYSSNKGRNLFGCAQEEIIGKTPFDFMSPEEVERVKTIFSEIVSNKAPIINLENWNIRKDGERFCLLTNGVPILDENGNLKGYRGVDKDITERKRAEEELRKSEERFKLIFEYAPDAYYLIDLKGTFIDGNRAAEKITGYKREELIGGSFLKLNLLPLDQLPKAAALLIKNAMGKSTGPDEFILKKKSGDKVSIEITTHPIKLEGRTVVLGIARDITERKRVEETMRHLAAIVESSDDAIIGKTLDGTITSWNYGAEKIYGYSADEIVGRSISLLIPLDQKDELPNILKQIKQGIPIEHSDTVRVKKDGSRINVSITVSPIHDGAEKIVGASTIASDITERKRAEEALRETTDYLESLLSFANTPIMVWDNNHRITKFNLEFERLTGYTMYDVLGQYPKMLVPARNQQTALSLLTRTSEGENLLSIEMPIRCKDGSVRTVLWNTANIYSADSKTIIATIAHGQDITERKRAEEDIRKLSSAVEQSSSSIIITNLEGDIEYVNPKFIEMTGYSAQEAIGKNPWALKPGHASNDEYKNVRDTVMKGEVWRGEFHNKKKNGELYWELTTVSPIKDSNGTITHYVAIDEDITQEKATAEQMRQVQKLESLGTLAGGIAHDFNNILGIILAYVSVLNRMKNDPEKLQSAVETISTAVQRGATLVRQILTFARKSDVEFGLININDVAKEVIGMILETFPRTLTYSQNLQKDIPAINADRSQIHQALLNLCVNARDAMPDGGVLTMNTNIVDGITLHDQHPDALASPYICVEVSDTGEGMTEDVRNRIFEPFFTTKEKGKGTGLGLAVVFGVVQTHKGFVDVESELGKGTTFRLYLPVTPAIMPAQVEIQELVKEIPGGTETLLVVEDEESLMVFIQMSLDAKGYTVLSAVDGPEAVKTYRERQKEISMVFTDLGLPGMTGMEEINIMKKINPDVKIIVATGFLDPEMKSELLKAGVKKFILKPYNFEEILKLVREVLDEK